jgi:hypothetical protein
MRQQDVFKKIGNILQELNEQYEYLKTQTDSIDDLELELFAANSHFLSDHLEILRKLNATLVKALPAHGQEPTIIASTPIVEPSPAPEVTPQPSFQFSEPEAIVEPAVPFMEEVPEHATEEPETVIELPAAFADETPEVSPEPEPTLQEYYHVETPAEEEPEAAPEPGGGFHFDFTTAAQPQEDADEYTSKQFQYQPEEESAEPEIESTIDEETEEITEAETTYKEEEPKENFYSFQTPVNEPAVPTEPAYHYEEPIAEKEEPVQSFEPIVSPIEINDAPAPEIDIKAESGHDMFSFMRTIEPETTHHELTLDEAEAWASDDEDRDGTINSSYHKEQEEANEPAAPTVAEAMAATVTPEPEVKPEPTIFTPQPEPAAIPTFQLNQTPPTPLAPTPEPVAEPERPLTLNERLSANAAINATAASVQPIKDLKSAITLNDKMLFVRDLFNGYSLAYSEAIEILNRFNNFDDAERFLNTNYVEKNHWADKPATNEKFFDLLRRRFA